MKLEATRLPTFANGVLQVWKRSYLQFKRFWLMNFFWIVLEPLLLLLAIGYGLGSFISDMKGVAYVDFFFPALLCMTSMFVSFFESTYGNFAKMTYQRTYSTMILTSLEPKQIIVGEILWATCKGTFSAISVALIASFFGHLNSFLYIPAFLVIFLSSFVFATMGLLIMSMVKSFDGIIYPTSGLIVPMSLFCGTYFPLEQLPSVIKYFTYLLPLTHSVALVRGMTLTGINWWQFSLHLLFLIGLSSVLLRWTVDRITKKLIL
ncbi:MAG: ABC transporter permease [Pseudobdellovibrionaceae bacterium]